MPRVERVGDDEQEKILIVLLDEKDKDNLGEKMDKLGDDATWHGCVPCSLRANQAT
jgi:hypothetical protein